MWGECVQLAVPRKRSGVPNEKINWVAVQNRESPYAVTLVDKKADLVPIDEDTASMIRGLSLAGGYQPIYIRFRGIDVRFWEIYIRFRGIYIHFRGVYTSFLTTKVPLSPQLSQEPLLARGHTMQHSAVP